MYLIRIWRSIVLSYLFGLFNVVASIKVYDSNDGNIILQSNSGIQFKENLNKSLNISTVCFRFFNNRILEKQYLFQLGSFSIGVSISKDNTLYSYGSNMYFWPENDEIVTTLYMRVKHESQGYRIVSYEIQEWPMNNWNSFCFSVSMMIKRVSLYLNGKNVLTKKFYDLTLLHGDLRLSSLTLMAKSSGAKLFYSLVGKATDIHVWSRELSRKEIENWSYCSSQSIGDIVSYDAATLAAENMQIIDEEKRSTCLRNNEMNSISFIVPFNKLSFTQTVQYCSKLGADIAVAFSNEKSTEMIDNLNQLRTVCGNTLYSGHKLDKKNSRFVSHTNKELLALDKWFDGEPNNYGGNEECVELKSHNLSGNKSWGLNDIRCDKQKCPACEIQIYRQFQLRGLCKDSEQSIDTQFYALPQNESELWIELRGYISSKISWNNTSKNWELFDQSINALIAKTNESAALPLGAHNWYFTNKKCNEGDDKPWRRLSLHLNTIDDKFCCADGLCIDWSLRCNNIPNCSDKSDEYYCSVLFIPNEYDSM